MEEYKNPNKVTAEQLIEILKSYDPEAIVLNGNEENIRVYSGKKRNRLTALW